MDKLEITLCIEVGLDYYLHSLRFQSQGKIYKNPA